MIEVLNRNMIKPRLLLALAVILAGLALAPRVWAHSGGTLQLANEPAGPYEISVWTSPDPARTELPLRVSSLVLLASEEGAADQEYVQDATVVVVATGPDGEQIRADTFFDDPEERLFYEADLELATVGDWQIEVQVEGPQGPAAAAFTIALVGAEANWLLLGLAGLGLAAAAAVVFWLQTRQTAATDA